MLCVPVMNGPRYAQQPARIGERTATQDQDLGGLRYRLVGPFRGGRATTVAGVSGDPRTYYFGTAGGGVWKTTNGGQTWTPIFDGQPVGAIGDLAVAPSNPNVLYVGTGDADLRNNVSHGNGVYKSVDAGRTWNECQIEPPMSPYSWVIWSYTWKPQRPGRYQTVVRATDATGQLQIAELIRPQPDGASGYHTIIADVTEI